MRTGQTVGKKKIAGSTGVHFLSTIDHIVDAFCRLGQEVTQIPDRVPRLDLSHPFGEQTSQG